MAFPEDMDSTAPLVGSSKGSSIMQFQSSTLFALILQLGLGILAIMYALPAFIAVIVFAPLFGVNPFVEMTTFGYIIVWAILPIVGVLQIRGGYRFYKRIPSTIDFAKKINIVAIILFGIDTIISAYENILIPYPEVIVYLAANILLVVLLSMQSVRNELNPREYGQSDYQFYN